MIKPTGRIQGVFSVWVVSYLFFLLCLANNFSAAHDSIHYLDQIVDGRDLFHQHHLLYHFLSRQWLLLWREVFPGVPNHYFVESFTALWGSAALSVCYLIFRYRFFLSANLAVAGVSVIAFSFGTWFYSVNVEVYAPPLVFILLSLYFITKKEPEQKELLWIAVAHSLAILFHQVNILFVVIVLFWIYRHRRSLKFINSILRYAGIGLLITGSLYFFAGWVVEGHNSPALFSRWILGYTSGHDYWRLPGIHTPVQVIAGLGRTFIGAHFIFQIPQFAGMLPGMFAGHGLRDELFLSRHISPFFAWILLAITLFIAAVVCVLIVRFVKRFSSMSLHHHVVQPLLCTLVLYSLFFLFWMPEILEFWILQMIIIWLLLIGMLPLIRFPLNIAPLKGVVILSVALFVVNYFGSVVWLKQIGNDWYYTEVKKLGVMSEKDLVIVEDEWILKDYVRYFTPAEVIATDETGFNPQIAKAKVSAVLLAGGRVYVYRNIKNSPRDEKKWQIIRSY